VTDELYQPGNGLDIGGQRTPTLGPNLAPFGDFASGVGGLLAFLGATVANVLNELLITLAGGSGGAYYDFPVQAGRWVQISVDARRVTAAQAALRVYDGASFGTQLAAQTTTSTTNVPLAVQVVAPSGVLRVYLEASGSVLNTAAFDNLVVCEIQG